MKTAIFHHFSLEMQTSSSTPDCGYLLWTPFTQTSKLYLKIEVQKLIYMVHKHLE